MKAKLMALILAAGLSITGIAMTTQAAGANTTDTCKHKTLYLKEHFEGATYYNGIYNWVTYSKWYYCSNSNCSYSILVDSYGTLELHNYEQIYYRDGRVQSICTDCGDSYFGEL